MSPNILFIMTDQHRFDGLSCHGGMARTPNLDRLASQGVDCRQYFSQAPVCVPSRCSLFSGRYPHATRVRENDERLAPHEIHLFKALKQAGYHLGYVEKNHLLEESEFRNFDFYDFCEGDEGNLVRKEFLAFKKSRSQRMTQIGAWAGATFHDYPEEVTTPYLSRQKAAHFLQTAPRDKPFCLTVSFSDPHAPHVALRKFEKMYPLDEIELPECPPGVLEQKAPRYKIKQEAQGSLKASDEDKKRYLAVYYSMISWVDENIGHILRALDERGDRDNTIIVFTSDHGDFNFHYGMCKKDLVLLDALLHVPFMLSWQGRIEPGAIDSTMVEEVDVLPTLLELADVPVPLGCQGKSLVPLLRRETTEHKEHVYAEVCHPWMRNPYKTHEQFITDWNQYARGEQPHLLRWTARFNVPGDYNKMIRSREWKYVWYADGFEELYDLRSDPHEFTNLAALAEHHGAKGEMKMRLLEWDALSEDPLGPIKQRKLAQSYGAWKHEAP